MAEAAVQTRFRVTGMDCAGCAAKVDTAVRRLPGIVDVEVSPTAGAMTLRHTATLDLAAVHRRVRDLGYGVAPLTATPPAASPAGHDHDHHHDHAASDGPWWRSGKAQLALACALALALAYALGHLLPAAAPSLFLAAMLLGLVPIAWRAGMAARAGAPFTIEMLMTVAAVGAVVIGAGEEAAVVVLLFLVGELLEGVAAGRARASIRSLGSLVPSTAFLEEAGRVREVPAAELTVGDVIRVRPGDRIPADGVIVAGESGIDESPVTGESVPVRKGIGAAVFAGTVNGDAALGIRVTAAAVDNTIARIVRLVEEAQERKAPTARFIERFARWYTPAVVVVATLVAILPPLLAGAAWQAWLYKGLAILLIGCPCALVISTPAAIAASLSAGARRGLLLKGGAVLENLGRITAVAFDKTGTLTRGRPELTDTIGFAAEPSAVLRLAAALETGSSHPLAKAVLARAAHDGITLPAVGEARAIAGKGIAGRVDGSELFLGSPPAAAELAPLTPEQARRMASLHDQGKTVAVLVVDGVAAGALAMRDEPRADARLGLRRLNAAGIRTLMLTGDNERAAMAIGRDLGIEVHAELLPEAKQRIVGGLQERGLKVAKVGDGINDAPALAMADIGIAMGGGTDVALETADAAVLHGRVADVAAMIDLSKRTMTNIRQNVALALGLKGLFLLTTVAGITGLWPAILADTGATVLVTLNALRLLRPSVEAARA